jgi:hypothetical protein
MKSLWITWAACLVIVLWTCLPILETPQLEPDDYRYLHHLQQLNQDFSGNLLEAGTVENRWDDFWWWDANEKVRFFRPTVVLSYAIDSWIWGKRDIAYGLCLSNLLIHLGCVLLVALLLHLWLGAGPPAFLASAAFAALWAHGEVIWYVAGRTDSLAALGFLAAFALHVLGEERPWLRWMALPCFVFSFLTKELTIALPVLLVLQDWLISKRYRDLGALFRGEAPLMAAYAVCALGVFVLKEVALGNSGSALIYPYFVSPTNPEFLSHLWHQLQSYSGNLFLAEVTVPFATSAQIAERHSGLGLACLAVFLGACVTWLRKDPRLPFFLLFAFLTWLPTSFVYLSERYLYLPSIPFVALLGLLVAKPSRVDFQRGLQALLLGFVAVQAWALRDKNGFITQIPRDPDIMERQLAALPAPIPKGARIFIINLPGDWLGAQFAQDQLRVQLADPTLTVRVLTIMPGHREWGSSMGYGMKVHALDRHTIRVEGGLLDNVRHPAMVRNKIPFPWRDFGTGSAYKVPFVDVVIREGVPKQVNIVDFTFAEPHATCYFLWWHANPDPSLPPYERRLRGRVEHIQPR